MNQSNQLIFLSSPAKTYNLKNRFKSNLQIPTSSPAFLEKTKFLWQNLKNQRVEKLAKILQVSENLAELNQKRFQKWDLNHTLKNSQPAISAFFGDVFKQLEIAQYSQAEINYILDSVFIISGFYGLLNGLNLIQPYRLEMKLSLDLEKEKIKLVDYWKQNLTAYFKQNFKNKTIVNLASKEYSQAVDFSALENQVINIDFKQKNKKGEYKTIGILAKKARGLFLNWAIQNQIKSTDKLKTFNLENYQLKETRKDTLTFYQNA